MSRQAAEWLVGGPPREVLADRRVKAIFAVAVAFMLAGLGVMVSYIVIGPQRIYEEVHDGFIPEFSVESGAGRIMVLVVYSRSDHRHAEIEYTVTKAGSREVVAEGSFNVDDRMDPPDGYYRYMSLNLEVIELPGPGRYNISLDVAFSPGGGSYSVVVEDLPVDIHVWEVVYWFLLGVLAVSVGASIATYVWDRRGRKPSVPLAPFVLASLATGVALVTIW